MYTPNQTDITQFKTALDQKMLPELFTKAGINPAYKKNPCPVCGKYSLEVWTVGQDEEKIYQWICSECMAGGGTYEMLAALQGDLHPRMQSIGKVLSVSGYLEKEYDADIKYFAKYKHRKSGFSNLDQYLTLYPGLMFIGGAASVGKTTFAVNLCDNLARRNEHIVYFSLEQDPLELVTKLIARRVFEDDPETTITNLDIKNGIESYAVREARARTAQELKNFHIYGGNFSITVNDIINHVNTYIEDYKALPIVVVDYLQLIAPTRDMISRRYQTKEIIDENIKALKKWQKDNELLVILISSFNRSSYSQPVSYEAFKESGAIEYTADYLLGVQLSVLENPDFYSRLGAQKGIRQTTAKERSDMIDQAQAENPKQVEVKFLKNRNGKQSFEGFFYYYNKNDHFRVSNIDPRKESLITAPDDDPNPFDDTEIL